MQVIHFTGVFTSLPPALWQIRLGRAVNPSPPRPDITHSHAPFTATRTRDTPPPRTPHTQAGTQRHAPAAPRPLTHTTQASSTAPQVFTQIFTAETHTQQGVNLAHSFNARDLDASKSYTLLCVCVCACGALPDDTEGISGGTSGCLAIKSCPQPRPQACKYGVRVNLGRANESLRSFPLFSIMCFASLNSRQSPITRFTTFPR